MRPQPVGRRRWRPILAAGLLAAPLAAQEARPVRHHDAAVNGIRLHYAESGRGRLMLFLHGFPEFWYAWRRQLEEFGRDHHAVAPDLRGYNLSDKPAGVEAYRLDRLVEDIRALAAQLHGGERFVLVGHDWGGVVAWAFAMAHPELLEKLVIVNAPHPAVFRRELAGNPAQQQASRYMLTFRSPEAEAILSANGHAALLRIFEGLEQDGHWTPADRQAYLEAWSRPGALTGGLNYYRASALGPGQPARAMTPDEEAAAMVRVPTLVIWGERDTALLTGNLEGLERYVPDLTVRRIAEGSHWVVHERGAEVNALIRQFLTR